MYGMNYGHFGSAEMGIVLMIVFLIAVPAIIAQIFYLLTLQRTLQMVSPMYRKMAPGQVWLMLIPFFSIIWNFLMIGYIGDSLRDEFRARNIPADEDRPGYQIGLWMCILPLGGFIPMIGAVASIGGLVCWILYWVKISNYKKMLENSTPPNQNPFMNQPMY